MPRHQDFVHVNKGDIKSFSQQSANGALAGSPVAGKNYFTFLLRHRFIRSLEFITNNNTSHT
jgi:hypothetical protein